MTADKSITTAGYLSLIGVPELEPASSPFDPGYDPVTVVSHLEQSAHLISTFKISMACWQIASEESTRKKLAAARKFGVSVCTGGGPFEVAVSFGQLDPFLDLCAELKVDRIEAGEGFADIDLDAPDIIKRAAERGLEVQFEIGKKHTGAFGSDEVTELIDQGRRWLDAGAKQIVIEARESAEGVGLFDEKGNLDRAVADRFAEAYGLKIAVFEAPNKASQFAFLNHFGPQVHLANIRLEELLRVEIYRRGLHSDAFEHDNLRPHGSPVSGK